MIRLALAVTLGLTVAPMVSRAGGPPCTQKEFRTEMIKTACQKGGQDEAKKEMIAFVAKNGAKGQKITKTLFTCNACHDKLDPNFERKPTAFDLYKQLGGK